MSNVIPPDPLPPDTSVGGILLVLTCTLTSFTIVTTVLRIWARWGRRCLGWDDYAITVCCLLAVVRTSLQIDSVKHGNGRHRWYISEAEYEYTQKLTWITQILLFTNIGLLKCSICILILRIRSDKVMGYCLYTMMAGLVVTNLEPIIVLLAQCNPIKKSWKPSTQGRCWPTQVRIYSIYAQVAYSVVTDLICAILPVIVLWDIKISMKRKIGICGLMSMGLIATAVAIIRASSLGIKTVDLSYDYCIAAIWANTELHLGIIATNLALSQMIWGFFSGASPSSTSTPRYGGGSSLGKSKSGYVKSRSSGRQQPYEDEGVDLRDSSDNLSHTSEIPLDSRIKKTTRVRVRCSPAHDSKDTTETLPQWNQPGEPMGLRI